MAELFFVYLRTGFMAGVMILAILLLRPLLRRAPRNICCILWLLVAVRLLLPFQLESHLSLQPRQLSQPVSVTEVSDPPSASDYEPVTELTPVIPSEPIASEDTRAEPETVFAAIWITGTLAVLLYAAVSYGILRYRVRDAVRGPDGAWESDRIGGAFLLGYCCPRICIPNGLSPQDRSFILAHEQAHRKRGDHWWKLLGMLCLSIHWYNPLVWVSYALLCRDIEAACDEQVIRTMELEERRSYSLALLNSGKRLSGFLAYPVAFGEISLKERIKGVLSYRKPGLWITSASVALTLAVAICFMTNPITAAPSQLEQKPAVQATEPTKLTTAPTTEAVTPTEPVTKPQPTEAVTAPTEATTQPTEPATEPATKPTEPPVSKPAVVPTKPTEPPIIKPTQPPATKPAPTEPTTAPKNDTPEITVIAEGKHDYGPVRWKVTSDGVLTISGNRTIQPLSEYAWSAYRDQITKIVVEGGIRSIPKGAFRGMYQVTKVQLPKTVRSIGAEAFQGCTSLTSLTIPYQVKELDARIFHGAAVKTLTFVGEAPTSIDSNAFEGITANVYYHAEYESWSEDQLQSYGGKITWLPL